MALAPRRVRNITRMLAAELRKSSHGGVAAHVVSGIRIPGSGVILQDSFNIRRLNTAATVWCTAAVGTRAGLGYLGVAAIGAVGVLSANLILLSVAYRINRARAPKEEQEILDGLGCICRTVDKANIHTMLITRLSIEAWVTAISREVAAAVDPAGASITASGELVRET